VCACGVFVLKGANFEKDQQAMKNQLMQLQILLTFVDPELANYLGQFNSCYSIDTRQTLPL